MFSQNKKTFLEQKNYQSYQLTAADLPKIVTHLNKKHNIKIIINGQTLEGKAIVEKNQKLSANADSCLSQAEALREIRLIQSTLKENENIGYLFTSNHHIKADHMEMVIITQNAIIQPIKFNSNITSQKTLYHMDNFLVPHPAGISPQADLYACGTLNLLYLKELLKNDAKQLKELCLMFPYYQEGELGTSFAFIPPPQVLRYSQSGKYNQYIEKMFSENDKITLDDEKKTPVKTLKKLLNDSMNTALLLKDTKTYEVNKNLLKELPKFKTRWLQEYKLALSKRDQMMGEDGLNRYLTYRAHKFEVIAKIKLSDSKIKEDEKIKQPGKNF